jgi:hypothetical protein
MFGKHLFLERYCPKREKQKYNAVTIFKQPTFGGKIMSSSKT